MLEYLRRRSTPPTSLLDIIAEVRTRWRMKLAMRGLVFVAAIGFVLLLLTAYGMDWARFTPAAIFTGRVLLPTAILGCLAWFLIRPLRQRVTDEQVALYLEEHEPSLQATLLSAVEASRVGKPESAALVRRVIEQAIEKCAAVDAPRQADRLPLRRYATVLATIGVVVLLSLVWGPGFLRNGVSQLFQVSTDLEAKVPYQIEVTPENATVHREADQQISAKLIGFTSEDAVIMVKRGPNEKFEPLPMVLNEKGVYEGMIFDIVAPLEYRVEADRVKTKTFRINVVELPYVQKLDLELRYPAYTGLEPQQVEDGGDVAAVRGTEVKIHITPTMKTMGGQIVLNWTQMLPLSLQTDGTLTGAFKVDTDGLYRIDLV